MPSSPKLALHDPSQKTLHMLFFGGLAQFYDEGEVRKQDDHVPFVTTISRVTRTEDGKFSVHALPINMPDFAGTNEAVKPHDLFVYFGSCGLFPQMPDARNKSTDSRVKFMWIESDHLPALSCQARFKGADLQTGLTGSRQPLFMQTGTDRTGNRAVLRDSSSED